MSSTSQRPICFRSRRWIVAALVPLSVVACRPRAAEPPPSKPPPADAPRLIVLVAVDQMRGDYLDRFAPLLDGGLRTLLDRGVRFTEAHHRHAVTNTGPGHATLATGCHPARHGIITNYWLDRDTGEEIYAAADGSPELLRCPTLGDWLRDRYASSKVFSVAGKDRAAVLMAGREADAAFYYDWRGGFTTSAYYREELPVYVARFNQDNGLDRRFGETWIPEPLPEDVAVGLGIEEIDLGPLRPGSPHAFGGASLAPGESFYEAAFSSPWIDRQVTGLAAKLIEAEGLGADEVPDLLALGLSALDLVGHRYGPDSREVLDTLLQIDELLEELFAEIDRTVGLEYTLVALTSDHGTAQLPEVRRRRGLEGRRIGTEEIACLQGVEARLDARFSPARWLRPGPVLDEEALAASGVEREVVEAAIAEIAEQCPSVVELWTRGELLETLRDGAEGNDVRSAFARSYVADRSPDFLFQWEEHFLRYAATASTHGSPYRYDSWVPLVLLSPRLEPGEIGRSVATADLAPTLAALAGVQPPTEIDGVDLEPPIRVSAR